MKFSILTPTLNRPEMLERAMWSVNKQSYGDWEHIVYNVGEPLRIVSRLMDPRVKVFKGECRGPALDFQSALELATGDIIHPLGDDDELEPDALEIVADAIGDKELLVGKTAIMRDGEAVAYRGGNSESVVMTLTRDYMLGGAVYWRKSLSDRVGGFDPAYDGAADFDLYVRFLKEATPVVIPDVLYIYHDHPDTDSRRRRENQAEKAAQIRSQL